MVKEIEPKSLFRYLHRTGPYVYLYKAKNYYLNNLIVIQMSNMSNTYQKINIFQIVWEKQISFNPFIAPNKKNTIYLYFKGILIKEIFKPTLQQTQKFFDKAMEYYKQRLEIYFINQGLNLIKDHDNTSKNNEESQIKELSSEQIQKILYRKR